MAAASPDPELCVKYAGFASHLDKYHFAIIYWFLFITNLVILFLASYTLIKGQDAVERLKNDPRKRAKRIRLFMALCLLCVVVSLVIVVMEAFSLLALQFCEGEDLISLYWSTWTMIQVGSLIAMMGVILAQYHSLTDSKHPPWALALGTPVLVIAGLLHLIHSTTSKQVKKIRGCLSTSRVEIDNIGPPMSQANTIQCADPETEDNSIKGEFIGFTVEGGPIVRFSNQFAASTIPGNGELLGHCNGDRPIVVYRKDSIRFLSDCESTCKRQDEDV